MKPQHEPRFPRAFITAYEAGVAPGFFQAVPVGLDIDKIQRIGGYEFQVYQLIARFQQLAMRLRASSGDGVRT